MTDDGSICGDDADISPENLIQKLDEVRSQLAAKEKQCRALSQTLSELNPKKSLEENVSEDDLQAILEITDDGFFACDRDWRLVYVNRLAESILGIRREEVLGKSHWEVFSLTIGTRLEKEYRRAAAGEIREFENFYEPLGRWFHNRCFPRKDGGISVYFKDVTDRKRVETELAHAKEQLQQTLSSITDGYYALDRQWRFVALNPVAENHFGKTAAELIGKNIWQETGTPHDSPIYQNFHEALKKGQPHQFDAKSRIRPNYWAEMHLYPRDGKLQVYFRDISERKLAEEALKDREAFLGSLIDAIPIPVFYKDRNGRYIEFNEAFEKFSGEERKRLVGKTLFDIHPPELAKIHYAKDNELFEDKGILQYETQVRNAQGVMRDVTISKSVLTDKKETPIGIIGTILDITERTRMENALKESQARLKALSDASFEAIFLSDQGVCLDQNQTAERMFGYAHDEAVGKLGTEWIIPEDRELVMKNMLSGREDPYEVKAVRKDGTQFPCEIQARMIDYQGRSIRVTSLRDITDRKRAEAQQRKIEERFRNVYEYSAVGIAITEWDGRFQQCNSAYSKLVGYTEEELQRLTLDVLIHPNDRDANLLQINRLKSGEFSFFEIKNRYLHKKGYTVWVHKFVSILPDETGRPTQIMALVSDITRSKKAKVLLNELNQKLLERTQLAGRRAVEIQTLAKELSRAEDRERERLALVLHDDLQQMLGYLKIKLTTLAMDSQIGGGIPFLSNLIDQCIERCRNLSNELSSRILKQKGFLGALRWLCQQMRESHGMDIKLSVGSIPAINSDVVSSMLIRSTRELLLNVLKHSGEKSAIIDVWYERDQVMLSVKDNGKGCDHNVLKEKRTSEDNFGLFSIENRVQFLGGEMRVESEAGNGFCVTIRAPLDASCPSEENQSVLENNMVLVRAAGEPVIKDGEPGKKGTIRVLLVDDHEMMLEGLSMLFQRQDGIEVVGKAVNGMQAVELALKLRPDVILMDVRMPVMNGIDATRQISELLPQTHIIGLSMHKDPDIRQAMLDAGARLILSKSGSPEELIKQIMWLDTEKLNCHK